MTVVETQSAPTPRRSGRWQTRVGVLTLAVLLITALFAPAIAPWSPTEQNLKENLRGPSAEHPLGQDKLGRDQLSRIVYGARVSLLVGATSVTLTVTLGVILGALAGYAGGVVDGWVMGIVDVLLAFPGILLAIALSAVLGPSLPHVIFALSVIGWTGYARLVRAQVLSIREREHVQAARALGMKDSRILLRHVLPLVAAPVIVQATFGMAGAIVAEASLSFLGIGVQPPTPSWGSMLNEGRNFLLVAPHLTLWPGTAILVTVLGLNLLGDGLRARLDVRAG